MQLVILAAGRGSWLPKKFREGPKCLTKINGKTLLEHNLQFYLKFKDRIIVTGYKSNQITNFAKKYNFRIIKNKKYRLTNMVYSLFLTRKQIKENVVDKIVLKFESILKILVW